jgi:hypothetical protein
MIDTILPNPIIHNINNKNTMLTLGRQQFHINIIVTAKKITDDRKKLTIAQTNIVSSRRVRFMSTVY